MSDQNLPKVASECKGKIVNRSDDGKERMIQAGRLLTASEVLQMWPIARETLSRLTHTNIEAKRIPCTMFGRKPLYAYDELMWYREKHRFIPKKGKAKK